MKFIAFNNGYCTSDKKYISKKSKSQEVKFPATFYYVEISGLKILLDAGYSTKIPKSKNIIIKLYSKITKVNCIKDADEVKNDYSGMSAKELYLLCVKREIEAEKRKNERYYIKLLEDADKAEDDWDDESDEDDDWEDE